MKYIKSNARLQVAILLFLFLIVTAAHLPIPDVIYLFSLTFGTTLLFELLFQYIRFKSFRIPYSGMVTGLILTLIIDPSALWYQILLITGFAMAAKHFLRIKRHIFNPAAAGLTLGWLFFGLAPSWWGASYFRDNVLLNICLLLIMLGIVYVAAWRMKRYMTVISFIIASAVLAVAMPPFSPAAFLGVLTSMGILFFGGLMVPEPMTSPIRKDRQTYYGISIALLNTLLVLLFTSSLVSPDFNMPDTSLVALLLANALFFKFR